MSTKKLPAAFRKRLEQVTATRAKRVIDHILRHGHVTTQELRDVYGYNHPPRGAQDVKDLGIPLQMVRVKGEDGRKIAAYSFGDPKKARFNHLKGRTALNKKLKQALLAIQGTRCAITQEELSEKDLQIDHRIPYQVAGDTLLKSQQPEDFMLLSRSANRSKSWACEHCRNFVELKKSAVCRTCYWARPEQYEHVAMRPERRLDIVWSDEETIDYDMLQRYAMSNKLSVGAVVKKLIHDLAKEVANYQPNEPS